MSPSSFQRSQNTQKPRHHSLTVTCKSQSTTISILFLSFFLSFLTPPLGSSLPGREEGLVGASKGLATPSCKNLLCYRNDKWKPTSNQWRGRSIASDEDGLKSRDHPSLNGSTIPQRKDIDSHRDMECQITLPNGIPRAKAKGLRWLSTIDLLKLASKPTSKLASKALIGWEPVSDRIVSAWFRTWQAKITFIQDYAPTEEANDTIKDTFYNQLQDVLAAIPWHDHLLLVSDYNAQLDGDRAGFESTIRPHGLGACTTDNGDRLCSFCATNDLCFGNTFFQHKRAHKTTWRAPGGTYENKTNLVCVRRRLWLSLLDVKCWRGADAGSDHSLPSVDSGSWIQKWPASFDLSFGTILRPWRKRRTTRWGAIGTGSGERWSTVQRPQ